MTNFPGNSVATILVGSWTNILDRRQVNAVLPGDDPHDELNMVYAEHAGPASVQPQPVAA